MNHRTVNLEEYFMDDADLTAQREEFYELARAKQRRPAAPEVEATGECAYCGEVAPTPKHRWCDVDCREMWQHQQTRVRINR